MLRRCVARRYHGHHYVNYYSPVTEIPFEYTSRLEPKVIPTMTDLRDPNNRWGLWNYERGKGVPQGNGHNRNSHLLDTIPMARAGPVCDLPPVPVYRQQIWCMGNGGGCYMSRHPRIHIKVPRGKVVICKWCRIKYINMGTDDDNDEDWQKVCDFIGKRPETKKQAMRRHRDILGRQYPNAYPNGPNPEIYRTWINEPDPEPEYPPKDNFNLPEGYKGQNQIEGSTNPQIESNEHQQTPHKPAAH